MGAKVIKFADGTTILAAAQCPECDRIFDLADEDQAAEWYYGHDCE